MMAAAAEAFTIRHSLCCGKEGCRRRALPPSLRFLGRRVYVEAVVLLASMTVQLAATWRVVRAATGVPRQTLRRWGAWWRGIFPRSATWELLRTRFAPPPPNETELPCSLVLRLHADLDGAGTGATMSAVCLLAARCLAPATTSSVPDGSRFVRG
jgi:hypothetical protein